MLRKLYWFLDVGPLFLYIYPSFLLEFVPGYVYLYILDVGVVPCHSHMYVGVQSWCVLLPIFCVGSAFHARFLCDTRITHVTGGGGGGGWVGKKSLNRLRGIILVRKLLRQS